MDRFDRLLVEQRLAIRQTEDQLNKLRLFSKDYTQLKQKLTDLSHCFTKNAIIPFSPKGLVFAKFIHTNEVLVHLGGCAEHFCEVSTHQALSILDSRIDRVEKEMKCLREQLKLLNDREVFTAQLSQEVSTNQHNTISTDDYEKEVEIREEYDAESEEQWLKQHTQNILAERKKKDETIHQKKSKAITFSEEIHTVKYISSSDSDTDENSVIHFQHSARLPRPVNINLSSSSSSPADVLMRICNTLAPTNEDRTTNLIQDKTPHAFVPEESPFSDISEHEIPQINLKSHRNEQMKSEGPISKFRALRHK